MSTTPTIHAVTEASGQLGRLVVERLLDEVPASQVVALVGPRDEAAGLSGMGVSVRLADWDRPGALESALQGVTTLLVLSPDGLDQVLIDAAKKAGSHSVVHAVAPDTDIPCVMDSMTSTASIGRFTWAVHAEQAHAAAVALMSGEPAGRVVTPVTDTPASITDLASEVSRQTHGSLTYRDVLEEELRDSFVNGVIPDALSALFVDASPTESDAMSRAVTTALSLLSGGSTPEAEPTSATLAA